MSTRFLAGCLAVTSLAVATGSSAEPIAPADCTALWTRADASAAGSLTQSQAQPYVTNFKAVDTDADGKISSSEFMKGCAAGHVHKAP